MTSQALFCGKCGTPVAEEPSGEESLELKSPAARRRGRGAGAAAEVTGAASDEPAAASRASFKGAMSASHKKARRKMPVLVLMALFMLAATTVAWAVYTFVFPTQVNEREIDWTPETVYAAMNPDRFDLEKILNELFAATRMPTARVEVSAVV